MKSRRLYKVRIGISINAVAGECYVAASTIREALTRARKKLSWLTDGSNHVVSIEELSDEIVE